MEAQAQLNQEQRDVISKVEKLLRLAGKNSNEAESSAATAKAMELLAAYNLDLGSVDATEDGSGKRSDEKLMGGFYDYERDLWARVADLNFCLYWNQTVWAWARKHEKRVAALIEADPENAKRHYFYDSLGEMRKRQRRQHRLVGRTVNIAGTKAMMGYLLGAIERLTEERLKEKVTSWAENGGGTYSTGSQSRSRWAVSYREGIARRIAEKLWDRRQVQIADEEAAAEAARRRAAEAGMKGASTETGLTLFTLRKNEDDANRDFLYGEGYSAKQAAKRANQAAAAAAAEAAYTAWAAANPEEAAKQEAEREAEARKRSARSYGRGRAEKERDWSAYSAGYEAGEGVGLEAQAEGVKTAGRIK